MTMRSRARTALTLTLSAAAALAVLPARADVSISQKTSMSLAGINIDIDSVEHTSADKQRSDSTVTCHGFLSLFCHNVENGRIVRLDKQVEWELQPKKKLYTETPFPTAGQRAEAQQRLEAAMEEIKKCPMPQSQNVSQASAPDTSHCQLSSPVLNVNATDEHATILGHDARKTSVVLSQTCTDTQTGDVCEVDYAFDTWLTTDEIAGTEERNAFLKKYLQAQGLDPNNPQLQRTVTQFMAPYADQLKQLKSRAADLKGYPLRTTFYMAFGGPHCGKAKQAQEQQASSSSRFSMHNIASNALAGGLSSLFHRGASAIHADSAGGEAASSAANEAADPAASAAASSMTAQSSSDGSTAPAPASGPLVRVVSLTTETTSIDTASIPSDQFEIPADWKLEPRKQTTAGSAPKCPTAGK
ncbi:MAG: hypothetical protein KGJ72_04130 [Gammaproteobacteria bacterium]|nr:hypothetical protein [Gammaproteobacteria bacterium]